MKFFLVALDQFLALLVMLMGACLYILLLGASVTLIAALCRQLWKAADIFDRGFVLAIILLQTLVSYALRHWQ